MDSSKISEYMRLCELKGWDFSIKGYDNYIKQNEQGIRAGGVIKFNELKKIAGGTK